MMPIPGTASPESEQATTGGLMKKVICYHRRLFKDEYKLETENMRHPESIENEIRILRYVANAIAYAKAACIT